VGAPSAPERPSRGRTPLTGPPETAAKALAFADRRARVRRLRPASPRSLDPPTFWVGKRLRYSACQSPAVRWVRLLISVRRGTNSCRNGDPGQPAHRTESAPRAASSSEVRLGFPVEGRCQARHVRHTLLEPSAGLRAWVAPLILFLNPRFCAGERRFQTEYAARANGMRRRSFIVLLESPSKDEC
jgi:hypothetical protein